MVDDIPPNRFAPHSKMVFSAEKYIRSIPPTPHREPLPYHLHDRSRAVTPTNPSGRQAAGRYGPNLLSVINNTGRLMGDSGRSGFLRSMKSQIDPQLPAGTRYTIHVSNYGTYFYPTPDRVTVVVGATDVIGLPRSDKNFNSPTYTSVGQAAQIPQEVEVKMADGSRYRAFVHVERGYRDSMGPLPSRGFEERLDRYSRGERAPGERPRRRDEESDPF